jgi:hypothetical protein
MPKPTAPARPFLPTAKPPSLAGYSQPRSGDTYQPSAEADNIDVEPAPEMDLQSDLIEVSGTPF